MGDVASFQDDRENQNIGPYHCLTLRRAMEVKKARKVATKHQEADPEDCAMDIDESNDLAHFQQQ